MPLKSQSLSFRNDLWERTILTADTYWAERPFLGLGFLFPTNSTLIASHVNPFNAFVSGIE